MERVAQVTHVLVGGDSHLTSFAPNEEYCNCFGSCCIDLDTNDCICAACDCKTRNLARSTLLPPREEVATLAELAEVLAPVVTTNRLCEDCDNPVFRNGTRGRFPKKCPECKVK